MLNLKHTINQGKEDKSKEINCNVSIEDGMGRIHHLLSPTTLNLKNENHQIIENCIKDILKKNVTTHPVIARHSRSNL